MGPRHGVAAALLIALLILPCAGSCDEGGAAKELQPMLKIDWREGPEYPMGIQEAGIGVINGKIIAAGGFTRSPKDIVAHYADAFNGKPSGFTKLVFLFDPADEQAGWTRIADIPGSPRQGAASAVVDGALYAAGGFNYTEPLSYRETYRLEQTDGEWAWSKLPCDLPFPMTEATAVVIGKRIYLFGGGDYFKAPGAEHADFHADVGRNGDPVGRALLMLDTTDIQAGWRRLADLPGTPRLDCGGAAAGGKVYVLGGVFSPLKRRPGEPSYYNVTDTWVYDPAIDTWSRLQDMPHGGNRRAVVFADRYIILLAGYKYAKTWNPDNTNTEVYTPEERARGWKEFFETTVLVYDTQRETLGSADPLLDKTSWPTATIAGDTIYSIGGEGGSRLWHPATFQIGKVAGLGE